MKKEKVRPAEQVNVLGIGVHPIDLQKSAWILQRRIQEKRKGYVCLAGVHGVMEAQRNPHLKAILAEALLVVPDGMPTVWMGHMQGFCAMQRVFGPDLMIDIISRSEFRNCVHFFCGGEPGVADKLKANILEQFPWVKIAGTYSPPFRPMTATEEEDLAATLRLVQPDVIWVGLSTPKQEQFMARYLPMLDTKLMIGVGAAFLFHTGAIKDSPRWVKHIGLQWLHRLWQEPSRLWKRYVLNNPLFVVYAFLQIIGLKRYSLEPGSIIRNHVSTNYSDFYEL
jgi:N-acetylglucosaminyldiphosphoundecaprenol N-acetyl-beta-D-mannosaminyltransferase